MDLIWGHLSTEPMTCPELKNIIWFGGHVPGGQQDQGHGVVLHDQGEGYQPPITSRSGSITCITCTVLKIEG